MSTPTSPPLPLTRERIAGVALELVDRDGLDALSMRRLARELGVGTMTLYGYFRDKDELLAAVVDAATADAPKWDAGHDEWRDQLAAWARVVRGGLERHPSLIQLRLRRPILTAGALRGTERATAALIDAGLSRAEASRCFRTVFLYTFGYVAFSAGGPPEELRRQTRAAAAELPPDEFPVLTASVEEMADTLSGDEQFEFGLRQILDGTAARIDAAGG